MTKFESKIDQISRAFVWEKGKWRPKKNAFIVASLSSLYTEDHLKLHGIGITGTAASPELEVYADPDLSKREITSELRSVLPDVKKRILPCKGFIPYHSLSVGDRAAHAKLKGYGTLGGFVDDLSSPYMLAISNNHVLANLNKAEINDDLLQLPDKYVFGGLHRFIPLKKPPDINELDAAVGWVKKEEELVWRPKKPRKSGKAKRGMEVYKYGAKTGYTEGTVEAISVSARVNYEGLWGLNFRRCLRIQGKDGPFSLPGDSGSLVVSKSGVVVGLLFAGAIGGMFSLANPFTYVEEMLGVVLDEEKAKDRKSNR